MKKPTFNNYGIPAALMFVAFIMLSFYTSKKERQILELTNDTTRMGSCHRLFVAKHDSLINDTVHTLNNHLKFIKAQGE